MALEIPVLAEERLTRVGQRNFAKIVITVLMTAIYNGVWQGGLCGDGWRGEINLSSNPGGQTR